MTRAERSVAELSTHGSWRAAPRAAPDLDEYRRLAATAARVPAGATIVAARRAFTRGEPLPPGGVLLGIDVEPGSWEPSGDTEYRCDVSERPRSGGRVDVRVSVELRSRADEAHPSVVAFALRWTSGAPADA
ncbi:hypothetical protein GCM10009640_15380 [Agrococcus citreus]|uniref:Uncharacterized protein n=1 Tax=Agrococcus citreus TaxID=84643 RepID=A0ABN1YVI3_9MICO